MAVMGNSYFWLKSGYKFKSSNELYIGDGWNNSYVEWTYFYLVIIAHEKPLYSCINCLICEEYNKNVPHSYVCLSGDLYFLLDRHYHMYHYLLICKTFDFNL